MERREKRDWLTFFVLLVTVLLVSAAGIIFIISQIKSWMLLNESGTFL